MTTNMQIMTKDMLNSENILENLAIQLSYERFLHFLDYIFKNLM